jgi:hypothetical protein
MPFTPRTDDDERAPRRTTPAAKTQMRGNYHPKSADGRNPCPDRRDRICTSDATPILKRPYG